MFSFCTESLLVVIGMPAFAFHAPSHKDKDISDIFLIDEYTSDAFSLLRDFKNNDVCTDLVFYD